MSLSVQSASDNGKAGDRKAFAVPAPNANAGIASALKAAYSTLPSDEQFDRLLARIK